MLHKHQAFFVFVDFVVSLAMLVITVLALTGAFNRTIEVNSCRTPVPTVIPSATPEVMATASPSASPSGLLRKLAPVKESTKEGESQ